MEDSIFFVRIFELQVFSVGAFNLICSAALLIYSDLTQISNNISPLKWMKMQSLYICLKNKWLTHHFILGEKNAPEIHDSP